MRYVSVLGGKFNICNRDRCIDTSVTLGHGGVPVDHAVLEGCHFTLHVQS